jgi:HEAT repeat protein
LEKCEVFFESFNMTVEAAYDKYFITADREILKGFASEDGLKLIIKNEIGKWQSTPVNELDGKTPVEYVDSIDSLEGLIELFYKGAVVCHDNLPDIFSARLRTYGDIAVDALLKLCSDKCLSDTEDMLQVQLMAVKTLGDWKIDRAVTTLIELLDYKCDNSEMISERVKDSLVNIGSNALESIIRAVNGRDLSSAAIDYLLMALSDIGKLNKSDDVYKCLKNSFLNMPDKSIGAICLGDYGDGRAIPALRGFLEKNRNSIDKETYYEIVAAIRRLGGTTDDF